jgi:hypothetical protein
MEGRTADDGMWPVAPDPEEPPPGKYILAYQRARSIERFSRHCIELIFIIVEPQRWEKKVVKKYYALPVDEPLGLESNYYRDWRMANNGHPPKRKDRMNPHVFSGYWHAELGLTKQKSLASGGVRDLKDGELGRIVVRTLLDRAAGAPRR